MNITIDHKEKTFNINFHRAENEEAFLSIKGCRIAQGMKGPFVSFPATKKEGADGYWNHVWGDAKFQSAVMQLVEKAKTVSKPAPRPSHDAAKARELPKGSGFDDMRSDLDDDSIPF